MTAKLVVRVLAADGSLLGWTEVRAEGREGALWAIRPVAVTIETSGTPETVSVHWADVNVEVRVPCTYTASVTAGQLVGLPYDASTPLITLGQPARGLPPVTVRQAVAIGVPSAVIGAAPGGMAVS